MEFLTWEEAVRWLLAQPDRVDLVRDCYYDAPLSSAARRFEASEEWQATLSMLPFSKGKVLDVGAGHGITSFALARAGWAVTALEPDPSVLVGAGAIRRLAAEEGLAIDVREDAGEHIPVKGESFDLVFARQVLHHARDLEQLCREIARVLKPAGMMVAVREHVISRKQDLQAFLDAHPLHKLYGGESAYMLDEYLSAFRSAGLEIRRVLRSFQSPVNYAPRTRESLREELCRRACRIPVAGRFAPPILASRAVLSAVLAVGSFLDRRPGRLHSFVCTKPRRPIASKLSL